MLALTGQTCVQHFLLCEALACQVPHQIIPALRSISATESLAIGLAEITAIKQFARGERVVEQCHTGVRATPPPPSAC